MTDRESRLDLTEYEQLLTDLEREIELYKAQRTSLTAVVSALRAIESANEQMLERASASISAGEHIYDQLKVMDLPNQIAGIESRYNRHQQSLSDVTDKMQQMVQEQQRASLETLQNAQHTRESLERIAKDARSAAEAHDGNIAAVGEQVGTLSNQLSDHVGALSAALRSQSERLSDLQRQLAGTRMVAIATLIVLIVFAALVAFNVV